MANPIRPAAVRLEVLRDTRDLEALVARHQSGLWRYVRALGAEAELADDLVQDSFLSAWQSRPEISLSNDRGWMAWLRVVARNRLISIRRRQKRQVNVAELAEIEHLFAEVAPDGSDEWIEALARCLGSDVIDDRAKLILERRYREDRTGREVASELGMSETAVGVAAHRAMAKLRACIGRRLSNGTA